MILYWRGKSLIEFKIADISMREQLISVSCMGFKEPEESVRFFYSNFVKLEDCAVCVDGGKVVSILHMIPANIIKNNVLVPCHYIYAATTIPEYRGMGYMSGLINFAVKKAGERGQKYSILVPANTDLYNFYEKFGYRKFFKVRKVCLTFNEMKKFCSSACEFNVAPNYSEIELLRRQVFNVEGSLVWDKSVIKYAFGMNRFFSGENIFIEKGYALCYLSKKNIVKVIEIASDISDIEMLLGNIYNKFGDHDGYQIKVSTQNKFFKDMGDIEDFGMIKPIYPEIKNQSSDEFIDRCKGNYPYMGLALE